MNWDDVRLFLAVARSGQFLSAARRVGVNHATLSRRVSALEAALGTQLLVRRPQGCELTEEGERFLAAAERMETEMLAAQAGLGQTGAAISGTVRIGAPDGFGVSFLAPRLGKLVSRHPELKLELVPVPRSFSLSRREADIAITIDRPEQGRLVSSKLTDYTLGLYAAKTYLAGAGIPETIDDLRRHRRIGYVEDLIYSASLDFTGEVMRNWNASLEISSATGQFEAVRSGAGIGILHNYIAARHPDLTRLLPETTIRRAYWITFHESARELARVRAVAGFIQELATAERKVFV